MTSNSEGSGGWKEKKYLLVTVSCECSRGISELDKDGEDGAACPARQRAHLQSSC